MVSALVEFKKIGIQNQIVESFNYQKYFKVGDTYLTDVYSPEIAAYKLKASNLPEVKHLIPDFLGKVGFESCPASLNDIDNLLADGWLVIPELNFRTLNGRDGIRSHVVLVYKKSGLFYELHDPGLPPKQSRKLRLELLQKAMEYIAKASTSIIALKPEKQLKTFVKCTVSLSIVVIITTMYKPVWYL